MANKPLQRDTDKMTIQFPYISNMSIDVNIDPSALFSSEEIKTNFRPNSCLASIIVDTFQTHVKSKSWKLTYSTLWKTCCAGQPEPKHNDPYAISLADVEPFFRQHRLKLIAVDIFKRILVQYDPVDEGKQLNRHISPCVVRVLVHQGHAYKLNANLNLFDQKCNAMYDDYNHKLIPSKHYHIREHFEYEDDKIIHEFDAIYQFILNYAGDKSFLKIISDADMEEALIHFRDRHGIVGSYLTIKSNTVTGFNVEFKGIVFRICNLEVRDADSFCNATNSKRYSLFMENYQRVYKALINKNHKSTYHPQFLDVLHRYMRSPLKGQLQKCFGGKGVSKVDEVKAYTRRLMDLKFLPVFDEFCFFRPYDKQKISEYCIYFVKSPTTGLSHLRQDVCPSLGHYAAGS